MYKLCFSQKLPIQLQEAWDFFSSPKNLERIIPKELALTITSLSRDVKIYSGQIIHYAFKPFQLLPMQWVTEIIAVKEHVYFIDQQKFGPYAFWHHEHWFTPTADGVIIEDILYYKMPLGIIGRAMHAIKIKSSLNKIFCYRKEAIEKIFGRHSLEDKSSCQKSP